MKWLSFSLLLLILCSCSPPDSEVEYSDKKLPEIAYTIKDVKALPVDIKTNKTFFVAERTSKIKQYACSNCHQGPLPDRKDPHQRSELMHLDIAMKHAGQSVMDCRTCHNTLDMNTLRLNNGEAVSFDHAYKLCSQCHFQQGKDWVGGAHGKRLSSWYGKRIVMNCTECHDPHSPSFAHRFPVARPTIPRTAKSH